MTAKVFQTSRCGDCCAQSSDSFLTWVRHRGFVPVLLSLIVYSRFFVFLATALLFAAIELSSNYVIEPWIVYVRARVCPHGGDCRSCLLDLDVGTVGLLLAVPLIRRWLSWVKTCSSAKTADGSAGDGAALPPNVSYYQRLLADDHQRAEKIIETAISENDFRNGCR